MVSMVGPSPLPPSTRRLLAGAVATTLLAAAPGPAAAASRWLGAVVDADHDTIRDGAAALSGALDRRGAGRVVLLGARASRPAVLTELDRLAGSAAAGDIVVLGFGGRGRRDPAPSDGGGWSVLLGGTPAAALSGDEIEAFVRRVEAKGARALVVLDTEFGGAVPRARGAQGLGGTPAAADGGLGSAAVSTPFARSTLLAASDVAFGSPPAWWPGEGGRGRLLARAVAHALDAGEEPGPALLAYAARVVYQLSDQRQQIAALGHDADVAARAEPATRGIVIKATARLGSTPAEPALPANAPKAEPGTLFPSALSPQLAEPIRIAPAAGAPDVLAKLLPSGIPARVVGRGEDPDLIWDPSYKNVLTAEGDLVADDIDRKAIGLVLNRTLAVRQLKAMVVDAPQQVLLLPDDDVKARGSVVTIEVGGAAGRSLILFNIRCDGKVQLLYPKASDPPMLADDRYRLSLRVSDPVGADAIVAVTASRRLADLEQGLAAINGQKAPLAAVKLVRDMALPGTQVGTVSIFSGVP